MKKIRKLGLIILCMLMLVCSVGTLTACQRYTQGLEYTMGGNGEFYRVTGIGTATDTDIVIPSTYEGKPVEDIGYEAFKDCTSLTSVVVPDSVTSIGYSAFSGCSSLTKVNYTGTIDEWVQIEFEGSYSNPLYYANNLYINDVLVTEANITTATKISNYAFYGCNSLTSVVIGEGVTSIGSYAFDNCSSLTSIVIPDSVTSIGDEAFSGCTSLTSVVIGEGVTSIGSGAFYGCSKLVEVYNKSSLNITKGSLNYGYVGYYALAVYTESYTSKLSTDSNGYIIYTDGNDKILVGYSGVETDLILPDGITAIYKYAFYNCDSLTSIVIPDSVTSIGSGAFYGCSKLESITLPFVGAKKDGTADTHFGYIFGAWSYSDNEDYVPNTLKSVTITGSRIIGDHAFYGCTAEIKWGDNPTITSIGNYAFYGYKGTSITIPDSVTSIGYDAFRGCTSLTSVVIGEGVTSIGFSAFYNCSKLTSIKYRGSEQQWSAISKGYNWNYNTGNYSIIYNYSGN